MVRLNSKGRDNLERLLKSKSIEYEEEWDWSTDDENKLLGENNWEEYAKWFLGEDTEENENTKARYKYPYGKNNKIYRRAIIAIKQRSAQQGHDEIYKYAEKILSEIEEKKAQNEILLYEVIGNDVLSENGQQLKAIYAKVNESEGDIIVRINSPGGSVFDGFAIYNLLKSYNKGDVIVYIDGIAASIASVIAMAGKKIKMAKNAMLMIHKASAVVMGTERDMDKMRDVLQKLDEGIANIYAERTGINKSEILQMMEDETWMNADEAIKKRFVDEIVDNSIDNEAITRYAAFWQGKSIPHGTDEKGVCQDESKSCKSVIYYAVNTTNRSKNQEGGKQMENIKEILDIGKKHNELDLAYQCIKEGKTKDEFVDLLLQKKGAIKTEIVNIDMPKSEAKKYSYAKAILEAAEGRLSGLEKEVSDYYAEKIFKQPARGVYVPMQTIKNAASGLNVGTSADGGYTVATELRADELVEYLWADRVLVKAGVRQLNGLVGNVAIPRQTGGATAYWVGEAGSITASKQQFGLVSLTPKSLAAAVPFTRNLLVQSSLDIESFIKKDLGEALGVALETAALVGTGSSNQPTGIAATTGVATVTFSGAATWAKILEFETSVSSGRALNYNTCAYIVTRTTAGKWKAIKKDNYVSEYLWKPTEANMGEVNGYRAFATDLTLTYNGVANRAFFGNWDDLIVATWGNALDLLVDPYTSASTGEVVIYAYMYCDIGVRRPGSFVVSTDSAAQ